MAESTHPLEKLCLTKKRLICREPWSLIYGESFWAVATDGRALLALRGQTEDLSVASGEVRISLLAILNAPIRDATPSTANLADLRQWAGEIQWPKHIVCNGCDCGQCEGGETWEYPDQRRGYLQGELIDRVRLAQLLSLAPAGNEAVCTLTNHEVDGRGFLRLDGDDWIAVLMPLVPEASDPETVPAYPATEAGR